MTALGAVPMGLIGVACVNAVRQHLAVNLRPANADDAEAIAAVHVRSWQAAYRGHIDDVYLDGLDAAERVPTLRTWLERPTWVVLEDAGAVIGFAHSSASRDEDSSTDVGEITTIYIDPLFWGRGGGKLLLDSATESLRGAGFGEASLWVLDTNTRARRFYEAHGWHDDGGRKPVTIGHQDLMEVRYRTDLAQSLGA